MSVAKRRKVTVAGPSAPVIKSKRDLLYEACIAAKPVGSDFTTPELLSYITIDEESLGGVCQELLDRHLFSPWAQRNGTTLYRTRSKEEALKLAKLSADNVMIYLHIEGQGRNGIWKRTLSTKSNLHENTVTKGLKELMSKGLIKEVRTSKNTTKRIYILSHLKASDESTGGNFYTDGELDTGLVHTLNDWIVAWVEERSWSEQYETKEPAKGTKRKRDQDKTSALAMEDAMDGEKPLYKTPKRPSGGAPLIPQPTNYDNYPTIEEILHTIEAEQLLKDMTLSLNDITQLVHQLVYDERLEEMSPGRYRSVRRVDNRNILEDQFGPLDPDMDGIGPGNGLTQVPCGRCPVASDCKIGGKISPDKCVYMDEWLQF